MAEKSPSTCRHAADTWSRRPLRRSPPLVTSQPRLWVTQVITARFDRYAQNRTAHHLNREPAWRRQPKQCPGRQDRSERPALDVSRDLCQDLSHALFGGQQFTGHEATQGEVTGSHVGSCLLGTELYLDFARHERVALVWRHGNAGRCLHAWTMPHHGHGRHRPGAPDRVPSRVSPTTSALPSLPAIGGAGGDNLDWLQCGRKRELALHTRPTTPAALLSLGTSRRRTAEGPHHQSTAWDSSPSGGSYRTAVPDVYPDQALAYSSRRSVRRSNLEFHLVLPNPGLHQPHGADRQAPQTWEHSSKPEGTSAARQSLSFEQGDGLVYV